MPCPVCGQTMQNLGSPARRVFWCGGCGTLKDETDTFSHVEMPAYLRHVVAEAGLSDGRFGGTQTTTVSAAFDVRREGSEPVTVKMTLRR